MHGYFEAGGGLALDRAVPGVDRAGIEAWRQGQGTLAYRPELLLAFPLHMDDPQRERLFRVTGFALLPPSQWHDRTALRTLIHSDAYLDWLDARPCISPRGCRWHWRKWRRRPGRNICVQRAIRSTEKPCTMRKPIRIESLPQARLLLNATDTAAACPACRR